MIFQCTIHNYCALISYKLNVTKKLLVNFSILSFSSIGACEEHRYSFLGIAREISCEV